jgi:hypothetical protein
MEAKYFTLEEANALLIEIEPLMEQLIKRRDRVLKLREPMAAIFESEQDNFGGTEASALAREFVAIERLVRRIRSFGCVLKDINAGLLDFLTIRDDREVYLCWRHGEPRIEYYHDLHTGYAGRIHIEIPGQ